MSKRKHAMLDLETISSRPDAAIGAIGAALFSEEGLEDTFYRRVDLQSSVDSGGVIDPATILWWLDQPQGARDELIKGEKVHINVALLEFNSWVEKHSPVGIWGNGVAFDNVVLRQAYLRSNLIVPWGFRQDRCYRTIKELFPGAPTPTISGLTYHRADHDAIWQAAHLLEIQRHHGLNIL